jgi:hypothetical protein
MPLIVGNPRVGAAVNKKKEFRLARFGFECGEDQDDNPHCLFSPRSTLNITFKGLNMTKLR